MTNVNPEPQIAKRPEPEPEGQRILQVRLSNDLYEWLRTKAFYQRRSMNAIVNEVLARARAEADNT